MMQLKVTQLVYSLLCHLALHAACYSQPDYMNYTIHNKR